MKRVRIRSTRELSAVLRDARKQPDEPYVISIRNGAVVEEVPLPNVTYERET